MFNLSTQPINLNNRTNFSSYVDQEMTLQMINIITIKLGRKLIKLPIKRDVQLAVNFFAVA